MELAKAERFINLFNAGYSMTKIAADLNQSSSVTGKQFVLLKVHGPEIFKDHYVNMSRPAYSKLEKACIVEYLVEHNINADRGSSIFRLNPRGLYKSLLKRKSLGVPLHPEAKSSKVVVPENIGNANYQALVKNVNSDNKADKPKSELTFLQKTGRQADPSYDVELLEKGENLVYSSQNAQPKPKIDAKPLDTPIGRATAPITKWRPDKKMRRKDVEAAKKARERQEARTKACEANSMDVPVEQDKSSRLHKTSHWTDPNPPHPAQEYFDKNGNVPPQVFFDPKSERFNELPPEVQVRSYERYCKDQAETITCLKKCMADISRVLA